MKIAHGYCREIHNVKNKECLQFPIIIIANVAWKLKKANAFSVSIACTEIIVAERLQTFPVCHILIKNK